MQGTPVGQPRTVTVVFDAGKPGAPSLYDPVTVTLSYTPSGGSTTVSTWSAGVPGVVIVRDSPGNFHASIPTTVDGFWRYRWIGYDGGGNILGTTDGFFPVDPSTYVAGQVLSIGLNGYPFAFGYCDVHHVAQNLSAGSWDPTKTGASPTVAQVEQLIADTAAQIDSVLLRTGYNVPLQVAPGFTVIKPQAFSMLKQINAALATALVERARFGSQGDEASDAGYWMTYADELLVRIQAGDDNLLLMGVSSAGWVSDPNPSKAMTWSAMTDANGAPSSPIFTRVPSGIFDG